ncbi:MAG: aldo/keto reductase [Candidatus Heimdallarchaeota archaeon]|nr:aldo/keto reductase [Candidatus Heimdallarchaeota archaeon]
MKYRNLGKQGLKVSEISIGTMYHGSYFSKKTSFRVLEEAVNQGINFIDCADRYGIFDSELPMDNRTPAEEYLGEFLQGQNRDDLVVSTKVFYKMRESPNSGGLSRKHIHEAIKRSLRLLQTNYIDIYFCHRPDRTTPLEETVLTMSDLIEEGIIHYWGTSWWPPTMVERAIWIAKNLGAYPPHAEQSPYHLYARFIEEDLLEVARFHGIGLVTFEALATGLITDKYLKGIPNGSRASKDGDYTEEVLERYHNRVSKLIPIAKELEIPISQMAIAWTLRLPEVSSSLMGASKPEQVISNAKASEVTLSRETLKQIDEALKSGLDSK